MGVCGLLIRLLAQTIAKLVGQGTALVKLVTQMPQVRLTLRSVDPLFVEEVELGTLEILCLEAELCGSQSAVKVSERVLVPPSMLLVTRRNTGTIVTISLWVESLARLATEASRPSPARVLSDQPADQLLG